MTQPLDVARMDDKVLQTRLYAALVSPDKQRQNIADITTETVSLAFGDNRVVRLMVKPLGLLIRLVLRSRTPEELAAIRTLISHIGD